MKKGWQIKTLGEICEIVGGGTPKTGVSEYWSDEIVWVTPKDLGGLKTVEILNTAKKISKKGLEKSSAKLLPVGSVVMSSRAPIGYVAIAGVELATNQGCRNFICGKNIFNKYLYYYLFANTELLNSLGGGATFKEISGSILKGIEIPLPPFTEQKLIVKILDEKFELIQKLKQTAEQLLRNANDLFESRLQEVFANHDQKWDEIALQDLCEQITVGYVGPMAQKYKSSGIPFLRSQNVKPYHISLKDVVYIDDKFNSELRKSQLKPGDLVIVRTGYPGTASVIPKELPISNCSDLVIVKVKNILDAHFLAFFLNSTYGKKLVLGNLVGAAQKHFNIGAAKKVKIPTPRSLSEQKNVIKELGQLADKTKKLERIYQKKISDLEELKKSYLEQAFSGNLS